MEEDTDGEGSTRALHTLSEVAANQGGEVEGEGHRSPRNTITPDASTSERAMLPLIPLQPAQKRPGPRTREPSKALGLAGSGVLKTRGSAHTRLKRRLQEELHDQGEPLAPLKEQRRSAPEQSTLKGGELRGSKSVPDFGVHALAAIRGIRAGTLQLDEGLRSKITEAAKKVLRDRELRRQTASSDTQNTATSQGQVPQAAAAKADVRSPLQPDLGRPHLPCTCEGEPASLPLPQSLATATAIARGEALPLGKPSHSMPAMGQAEVKEPASPKTRHSAPGQGSYRPFTVTTGVPRFSQGNVTMAGLPSAPQTPAIAIDRQPSLSFPQPAGVAAHATLLPAPSTEQADTRKD